MPDAVRDAYFEALTTVGNPASQHAHGQQARDVLESAREKIAASLRVTPAEVVFTSGGTEAINLAIKGLFWARRKPVILTAAGEHHATLDTLEWLEKTQGAEVHTLPLREDGVLEPETLRRAISDHGAENIALATVLWVNNEIGTVQPISELSRICDDHGIPLHVDAVAALGQLDLAAAQPRPAAMSLSAHKVGGPVSSGALVLRRDTTPEPLIHGGSQQRVRSGTQDAAAAVAFATAVELTQPTPERLAQIAGLRDRLIAGVRKIDPTAVLRGPDPADETVLGSLRAVGNAHFTFPGCQGDSLLFMLDMAGVSVSTGSACTAGVTEVSHVMLALGLPEEVAAGALRFTVSAATSDAEIDALLEALPGALTAARKAGFTTA